MNNTLSNEKGFTLLEAMMAAVVLFVGILAVMQLFTMSINGRRTGKDLSIANNLAKRILEDVKNVGVADAMNNMLGAFTVTDPDGSVIYDFKAGSSPAANTMSRKVLTGNKEFTVWAQQQPGTPDADLATVTVKVSWVGLNESGEGTRKSHTVTYETHVFTK